MGPNVRAGRETGDASRRKPPVTKPAAVGYAAMIAMQNTPSNSSSSSGPHPSRRPAPGRPPAHPAPGEDPRPGNQATPSSPVGTYFVTLRLADAMPKECLTDIKGRAAAMIEAEGGDDLALKRAIARLIEEELNRWHGDCWLRDDEVARTVVAALQSGHGRKYTLRAWSLLPNHLQAVFSVADGVDAGSVVREWRNYTTRQFNLLAGRDAEELWEKMPYLKACMDDAEVVKRVRNVEFRPVNAGLCRRPRDWKWSSARQATPTPHAATPPSQGTTHPSPAPSPAPAQPDTTAARPPHGKAMRPPTPPRPSTDDEDPFA